MGSLEKRDFLEPSVTEDVPTAMVRDPESAPCVQTSGDCGLCPRVPPARGQPASGPRGGCPAHPPPLPRRPIGSLGVSLSARSPKPCVFLRR